MVRILKGLLLVGAVAFAILPSARAGYDIQVFVGGNLITTIAKGDTLDLSADPNAISVDTSALNLELSNSGSNIRFNSLSAAVLTNDPTVSKLSVSGQVLEIGMFQTETVTILTSFNGYNLPLGSARAFVSTRADNFSTFESPDTRRDFISYFIAAPGPLNQTTGANSTPSATLSFVPDQSQTSSGADTLPIIVAYSGQYTLTNVSTITLRSDGAGVASALDNFGGTTTVRAVPEPGSIALLCLGGVVLANYARRKRVA